METGPSGLEVPLRRLPVEGPLSSATARDSEASVKESSTGVTLIVSVEVTSGPTPSETEYETTGKLPLKLRKGVKVYSPFALTIMDPFWVILYAVPIVKGPA